MGWYPKRRLYFRTVDEGDETEQGDIFWGVPTLVARHPCLSDTFIPPSNESPVAEMLALPTFLQVIQSIRVSADPVIVLPHTCDFYGPEKGRRNRARLVAAIQKLADAGIADAQLLRSGEGYNHTFFLPSWQDTARDVDDMFVNLRCMTTVDAAYLSRKRRLARLSLPALLALRRRTAYFFTDYAPSPKELALADIAGGLVRHDRDSDLS